MLLEERRSKIEVCIKLISIRKDKNEWNL